MHMSSSAADTSLRQPVHAGRASDHHEYVKRALQGHPCDWNLVDYWAVVAATACSDTTTIYS